MNRSKEDAQKTRSLIVDSAYKIFLEKGYEATTLKEIVEQSGLSRGAMYWYFDNKGVLYIEVIRNILEKMYENKLQAVEDRNSIDKAITNLLMLPIDYAYDYKLVIQTIELANVHSELKELVEDIINARSRLYNLIMNILQKEGRYSEEQLYGYGSAIYYMFEGFVTDGILKNISYDQVYRMVAVLLKEA